MAKSKSDKKSTKKVVDEEPISQPTDAEVDFDVSASEVETDLDKADEAAADAEADADVEPDAEADAADVDAEADADGDGGDEDAEPLAQEPAKPPKSKVTWLTIVLLLLNWIVVPVFVYAAFMDHAIRLQYSYRTLFNYTQVWGLPLADEKLVDGNLLPSVSNETRPVMRLSPDQLKAIFKARKGVTPLEAKDAFAPVEESPPLYLTVDDMTDELLEDLYGSAVPQKERFATLDAALEYVREKLPGDIAEAAKQVKDTFANKKDDEKRAFVQKSLFIMTWDSAEAKKTEDLIANATGKELDDLVKRALVEKILYPIALDYSDLKDDATKDEQGKPRQRRVWIVDRIDENLARAKGADLDTLVDEAVQRRIYYDILAPINLYRPGDLKNTDIERIADRGKVKLERVKELLDQRLKAAVSSKYDPASYIGKDYWGNPLDRGSIEKRQTIGFILFTLAQVQVPALDKKLYPKGIERVQTVSGLYEFTNASIAYVQTKRTLEQRMEARVKVDRDGFTFGAKGNENRTPAIIDFQPAQLDRMLRLVEQVDAAQKRIDEKKIQRDHFRKIYDQRLAQYKAVVEQLLKARKGTETYAKELRQKQDELHNALIELSDAADTNFQLEAEIRALELSYFKTPAQKGGKKQP